MQGGPSFWRTGRPPRNPHSPPGFRGFFQRNDRRSLLSPELKLTAFRPGPPTDSKRDNNQVTPHNTAKCPLLARVPYRINPPPALRPEEATRRITVKLMLLAKLPNHQNIYVPHASTPTARKTSVVPALMCASLLGGGGLFKSCVTSHHSDSEATAWVPCPHERRLWNGPVRTRVLRATHAFAQRPPPKMWTPMFSCFLPSSPKKLIFTHFFEYQCLNAPGLRRRTGMPHRGRQEVLAGNRRRARTVNTHKNSIF